MSEFGQLLEDKCLNFSVRIFNLMHFLNEEKSEFRVADQIFRSSSSIGANMAEAQCAISHSDFISKAYIALKESNETLYWLKLLFRSRLINQKQFQSLYSDAEELNPKSSLAISRSLLNAEPPYSAQKGVV